MRELKEVEHRLRKLCNQHKPGRWVAEDYIGAGASQFKFLNLKVPHIRQQQKVGYSFSDDSIDTQWKIWSNIWDNTAYFEVALSAAHFINSRPVEEQYRHRKHLIRWQKRVDNWALSDELSNCFSRLLEHNKSELLPRFERWSVSRNPWDRRQSMVGLLFYSRFRRKTLACSKILSFVEPHLNDSHYYVQKAVGWTLRECWNVYPERTMTFMKKHAGNIPPAGWTAATEKLSKRDKCALKTLRNRRN